MSVSTEVQRTLVKSPPELWAELSSPEALTRHLGDFGEIKITSVEPETKVEWEAEGATGVVHLKQSGWGTKVTLSVTRNPPAAEEPGEPEPAAVVEPETEPASELEPATVLEPELEPMAAVEADPAAVEPEAAPEPEPVPVALIETEPDPGPEPAATVQPEPLANPEPRLGFFARFFRKRKAKPIAIAGPEPDSAAAAPPEIQPEPQSEVESQSHIEVVAMAAPEPIYPEPALPEPVADLAAELASVEEQMDEETAELLTGVLDRLGAAHHRPFSRG